MARGTGAAVRRAVEGRGGIGLSEQIGLAITMLQKTSRAVYLDSRLEWDSHDDFAEQGTSHDKLFEGLSGLMDQLEEDGLLSSTTVVVMSELGRTPKINGAGGKDHWPVTSAMVIGAGVKPGAYGGTDNKLNARRVDLDTGVAKDDGQSLRYDNFAAGVLELVGVDPQEWLPNVTPIRGFHA